MHLDLIVSDIEAEATCLGGLGATRQSQVPIEEHGTRWIVMADPEGSTRKAPPLSDGEFPAPD